MLNIRRAVVGLALVLSGSPVMAADTTKIYNSGLLVLLFVGFCALLVVVQVLPAILSVMGLTKKAAKGTADAQMSTAAAKKH